MARPAKVGLDYFSLDCHMDEKIELIEAEFGLKGFAVIVKLYQSIYSGFGYYCEWTPEISVLWAYRLGCTHKVHDDENREIQRKYEEFVKSKNGHVCHWQANYNCWTGTWSQNYDPMICSRFCMNVGKVCDFTHLPVSKKKGNVFYDVKISYTRHDGTLFDGEKVVKINKGVRFFETAKSMTVCEAVVRKCSKEISDREKQKRHLEICLYGWEVEVLNVRAEYRESRDLMQDLKDIQDGIEIIHASDLEKQQKAEKKERRVLARQKKIERLEKKLLDVGYYNLEEYSLDKVHADKWLGEERIAELEELRKRRLMEEQEKPVQLSLFDMNW